MILIPAFSAVVPARPNALGAVASTRLTGCCFDGLQIGLVSDLRILGVTSTLEVARSPLQPSAQGLVQKGAVLELRTHPALSAVLALC